MFIETGNKGEKSDFWSLDNNFSLEFTEFGYLYEKQVEMPTRQVKYGTESQVFGGGNMRIWALSVDYGWKTK